jgi:hypothetical protein
MSQIGSLNFENSNAKSSSQLCNYYNWVYFPGGRECIPNFLGIFFLANTVLCFPSWLYLLFLINARQRPRLLFPEWFVRA